MVMEELSNVKYNNALYIIIISNILVMRYVYEDDQSI